jgi:DNA-binding transcriptional MerR regulator|tara:strand:+ start:191 stop:1135 length:945 start_codon:yes stop_codon:yes gene_type:complete
MSEEAPKSPIEVTEVTPQPEPQTEFIGQRAPEPQEQPPAGINLDSKVTVDGQDFTVAELLESRKQVQNLSEYRDHASKLMRGEGVTMDERESSVRWIMTAEGYQPEQIEEYVNIMRDAGNPQPEPQAEAPAPQNNEQYARLEQQMAQQQQALRNQELSNLRRDLEEAVNTTVVSSSEINSLISAAKRLGGDDNANASSAALRQDLERETVAEVKRMRAAGVTVDSRTFQNAAQKAASAVSQRYRAVIGDPNLVMRAPETDSGQDALVSKKPPVTPTYEPGKDDFGTAQHKARKFAEDSLNQLASEIAQGGNSRI